MICTDTSDSKGLSGTGDEDWEYFQRMNEGSFVKILSHTRQYTLLMQKRNGRLYLIMEGNRVLIIPSYNGATVALPPNGRCFTPVTYDVLEKEGFQCSNTIDNVWIPKAP